MSSPGKIDYNHQRFEELLSDIDLVFNATPVRDESVRIRSAEVMKAGSIFVCTHLDSPFSEAFKEAVSDKGASATMVGGGSVTTYTSSLDGVTELVEAGKLKAVISKTYPLAAVAEAHRESETKHVRGKIVLEIRKEEQ